LFPFIVLLSLYCLCINLAYGPQEINKPYLLTYALHYRVRSTSSVQNVRCRRRLIKIRNIRRFGLLQNTLQKDGTTTERNYS